MTNAAPKTKTAQIREAWAAGDKLGALRIASKFGDQSGDTKAMKRGWDAHSNPGFYRQIGKNPADLTEKAFAIIERKFIASKTRKQKPATKPAAAEAAKADSASRRKAAKDAKPTGKRAAIIEAAQTGKLPPAPDFSAPSHARYRAKLAELVKLAKAGDVEGLREFPIKPYSSSPKAMDKFRNLAIIALEAKAEKKAGRAA